MLFRFRRNREVTTAVAAWIFDACTFRYLHRSNRNFWKFSLDFFFKLNQENFQRLFSVPDRWPDSMRVCMHAYLFAHVTDY